MANISKLVLFGDAKDKLEQTGYGTTAYSGKNAVKVTIEISEGFAPYEVEQALTDIFQNTIRCFQQVF